jgi:hypothetical protein
MGGVSWFRVRRGVLEYRGRITRDPFNKWTATRPGREAVARVARGIRFSLFGRARAAKRRLWRALEGASRDVSLTAAIEIEAARYMEVAAGVAYADALPRAHVALRRLVLAPRAMIAGRAHAAIFERLGNAPALRDVDDAVRAFFIDHLVVEMDAAVQKANPSPRTPIHAHDGWACVGIKTGIVWADSLWAGPDGTGHVFLYEFPREGLTRKQRKALEAAIADMAASVSTLSRAQRIALVQTATLRRS